MTLSAALTSTSSRLLYSLRLRCATNVQAATHQACGRSQAVFISKIIMKGEGEEGLCIYRLYRGNVAFKVACAYPAPTMQ